jgi:threonine dehydrogenase-like Zn-dependent dehydrogenase
MQLPSGVALAMPIDETGGHADPPTEITVPFLVGLEAPGHVTLMDYQEAPLAAHEVRIRTLYSGISAGTELSQYRGSNPYMTRSWDGVTRMFTEGSPTSSYPLENWGYEEVGRVSEVGSEVTRVTRGELIWGAWGHRSSVTVSEPWAERRRLDPRIDPRDGIFARMGAIAMNAVLDAGIHVGEVVAVFGCGVLGQLAGQLARLNGAFVAAIDVVPDRLSLAEQLGATWPLDASSVAVAEQIRALTDGRGADVSIEMSGIYTVLHEAIRATAYGSRVVSSGFMQGEGAGLRLGDEFHHNRIELVCSQISGVAPALAHRWDRDRLETVFLSLVAQERVRVAPLITHTISALEAADAFALLDRQTPEVLQVVLEFPEEKPS